MATPEEASVDYAKALVDLKEYSKPQIKFLTMLAEDSVQYAPEIVRIIEAHVQKVKPSGKLPAIYLIDSIVKDLNQSSYKSLLMKNIVHTFTSVFEKVDKKTRAALYKVRRTWVGVFPNSKLYSIDVQINSHLDPAWPITATPPEQGSTHVDPRFLQSRQQSAEAKVNEVDDEEEDSLEQQEDRMRQEIIAKHQELLKLKQHTIDLELVAAKQKKKNMSSQSQSSMRDLDDLESPTMEESQLKKIKIEIHTTPMKGSNILDDVSDLFGREDQDYRSGHAHCSTSNVVKMGCLLLQSPSSKGWDKFKTSHSEDCAYDTKLKRLHQEAQDTESHMSTTDLQDGIVPTNVASFSQHGTHIPQGMFPAQQPPTVPNSMLPQYYTSLQSRLGNLPGPHGIPQTSVAMGPVMQGSLSLMDPRTLQPSLLGPGPRLMTSPLPQMWPQLSPLASLPALVPPAVNPIPTQPTVDVSSLFSKLVAAGILTSTSSKEPVKMETETQTKMKEELLF